MVSMIRLLQRQKTDRHTIPYSQPLSKVLNRRFQQTLKLSALITIPFIIVAKILFGIPVKSTAISLGLTGVITLLSQKQLLTVKYRPSRTEILEIASSLVSRTFAFILAAEVVCSWLWFRLALIANKPEQEQHLAWTETLPDTASYIPPGLPRHYGHKHTPLTQKVINEKYLYTVGYGLFFAIVFGLEYSLLKRNRLVFRGNELGTPAFKRLEVRVPAGVTKVLNRLALATLSWFLYWIILQPSKHLGGNVSGFPGIYSTLVAIPLKWSLFAIFNEIVVQVFQAYMTLGPAHRDSHTISDASPDPNGTLITGMESRPGSLTQLMAWYELAVVASHHPNRRQVIFSDVDADRTIWQQIFALWLKLSSQSVSSLESPWRALKEKEKLAKEKELAESRKKLHFEPMVIVDSLSGNDKRGHKGGFAKETIKSPDEKLYIDTKHQGLLQRLLESFIKSGEHQSPFTKSILNKVRAYQLLIKNWADAKMVDFLKLQIGEPFRYTTSRQLAQLLPEPERQVLVFALRGTSQMILRSLEEDNVGYVQSTIGGYLDSVESLLTQLEYIIDHPIIHWTDAKVAAGLEKPDMIEVQELHREASSAFEAIVEVFYPYFDNLKISNTALRRAKKSIKAAKLQTESIP